MIRRPGGRLAADQAAAASRLEGRTRVVAGAGSGKTAVIAERFRRLLDAGATADQILVLTFSERAAGEMRERIGATTGIEYAPAVGTFHSLAMRWLREFGDRAGLKPGFDIQEGVDRWIALRELMWELGQPEFVGEERPDDQVGPLLKLLERLKQELVPLDRVEEWSAAAGPRDADRAALLGAAVRLFREHEVRMRKAGLLDFDDLLVRSVRLLEADAEVRGRLRARHPHLMIDEYQDTNLAQERMVELLAGRSVFVVGDDDQSIYRFRGAALASMARFQRVFPDAETLTLGRNRRSPRSVVRAAARLVEANPGRLPKLLDASRAGGHSPLRASFSSGESEAAWIAEEVARLASGGVDLGQVAVLTRTHAIGRTVVQALRTRGLPVRHQAAQGFFGQPEVRDVTAMLRLVADPGDTTALARITVRPPSGADLESLVRELTATPGTPALEVAARRSDPLGRVATALLGCSALASSTDVVDLLFEVMERTGYPEAAASAPGADPGMVTANLDRLADLVAARAERGERTLASWLARQALVELSGFDAEVPAVDPSFDRGQAVQVMTIHQAKGLEFDAVFIPSVVEGRMPQPHRKESIDLPAAVLDAAVRAREDHVAEERRLLYVGMTRTRERLYLSAARHYGGGREWAPSRFLGELGDLAEDAAFESAGAVPSAAQAPKTPEQPPAPGLELSFSAIATYRECPRQYDFRYRLRLPPPPTVEGRFGDVVHAVLMRLGADAMAGRAAGSERAAVLVSEEWGRVTLPDERRRPVLERLALAQVATYLAAGGLASPPAAVERSFTADLGAFRLRGVIDRVDDLAGGGHRLVDYKTGAPLPASRLRRDLQLALYAAGAERALGLEVRELSVVYLKTSREVSLQPSSELVDQAVAAGGETAAGIARGAFEPRPERRRCSLCAFNLACPAAYR